MAKPYFSLILPVCNNASSVLQSLIAADYALSLSEFSSEIIVVDDASTDDTFVIAEQFKKVLKSLRVIRGKTASGLGWAIKEGVTQARGNIRMVIVAPQSLPFLDARSELVAMIRSGVDVIVGARDRRGVNGGLGAEMFHAWRACCRRIVFGNLVPEVSDVFSGAFMITEDAAQKLFSYSDFPSGPDFLFEFFVRAKRSGFCIREVAFTQNNVRGFTLKEWIVILLRLFRIRMRCNRSLSSGTGNGDEV